MSMVLSSATPLLTPPDSPRLQPAGPAVRVTSPRIEFNVGVETELFLERRVATKELPTILEFSLDLRDRYMEEVGSQAGYPALRSQFVPKEEVEEDPGFEKWSVINEISLTKRDREPWGLEVVSPKLAVAASSPWRSHVKGWWQFLDQNYIVSNDTTCGTHVHISLDGEFSVAMLQEIAVAAIFFEPAIEALVPQERRGNRHTASNWIDNPSFGQLGRSRYDTIARLRKCRTKDELIWMISPGKPYGWNFWSLNKLRTIEFRRGSPSKSQHDVFMWIDFVVAFIRAAITKPIEIHDNYLSYAPTVGGLFEFLADVRVPDSASDVFGNAQSIARLFDGRQFRMPDLFMQPIPAVGEGLALLFDQEMYIYMFQAIDDEEEAMPGRIMLARRSAKPNRLAALKTLRIKEANEMIHKDVRSPLQEMRSPIGLLLELLTR